MKKSFTNLSNWCNEHKGIIELMILLLAFIALIPFNRINFNISSSFIEKIILIINYKISIPIYLIIIILAIVLLYSWRISQKYSASIIDIKFLVGRWRNEWTVNGQTGTETLEITADGRYFLNGAHWFNIDNFKYDAKQNQITFTKVGVRPNDTRRLLNTLIVNNNELLTGSENEYNIRYSKIN